MLKGAVFTLGLLATIGGGGFGLLALFAAGMSDAPQPGLPPETTLGVGIAVCGIVAMLVAWKVLS